MDKSQDRGPGQDNLDDEDQAADDAIDSALDDALDEEEPAAEEAREQAHDPGPGAAHAVTYIRQLEQRVTEQQATLARYISAYKDLEQDKEQFKARLSREKDKELEILRGRLINDLLELMDNLDRSMMGAESSRNYDALVMGIKMVQHQFEEKLGGLGVSRVSTVGQAFDPNQHEALDVVAVGDKAQDGVVVNEYARGFRIKDRIIRPAKVRVGRFGG